MISLWKVEIDVIPGRPTRPVTVQAHTAIEAALIGRTRILKNLIGTEVRGMGGVLGLPSESFDEWLKAERSLTDRSGNWVYTSRLSADVGYLPRHAR